MVEKKNLDYTLSAENLTNPPEVGQLLLEMRARQKHVEFLDAILRAYPEYQEQLLTREEIADLDKLIRQEIDKQGSYQDVDAGLYGIKQKRIAVTYTSQSVRSTIPESAQAVIEETVNRKKIEGLIKGGLITPSQINDIGFETTSFAYIVKV